MNMYFWIEPLMSSSIWTVIFRLRQRRSRQPHELALECVSAEQQKEDQERDHHRLAQALRAAPIELCHRKLPSLNVGWSTMT